MQIRPEARCDEEAISAVITAAFLQAVHSGGNEAEIVVALRSAASLAVSLVATESDSVVGHVAFSPVLIQGQDEGWFGLAPVAVLPLHHRRGVGCALIEAGLARLRALHPSADIPAMSAFPPKADASPVSAIGPLRTTNDSP
jgi:putative acetyltransferase